MVSGLSDLRSINNYVADTVYHVCGNECINGIN